MPDISKLSGALIDNVGKVDSVLKADIASIDGVTVPSGADFPLDTYGGATLAWSVRRLYSLYTGDALRVRRDSDDVETDIGFDSNGEIDTAAIATHCGSANGYVTKWYGQESAGGTGSGLDGEETTFAAQPQIYNGSAVLTNNGKPCVEFVRTGSVTGTGILTTASVAWSTSGALEFFLVFDNEGGVGNQETWSSAGARMFTGNGPHQVSTAAGALVFTLSQVAAQNLFVYEHNSTARTIYIDGVQEVTSASPTNVSTSSSIGGLGVRYNADEGHADILFQELIHYPTNQSSNRTGIETNINDYFTIY